MATAQRLGTINDLFASASVFSAAINEFIEKELHDELGGHHRWRHRQHKI